MAAEDHAIGKHARRQWAVGNLFEGCHKTFELISFLAIILGAIIGIMELHDHLREERAAITEKNYSERIDVARSTYNLVDERFFEFTKICIDHPRLDCYSIPLGNVEPPLTQDEIAQQKMLYTVLSDVFEVAYVSYHQKVRINEVKKIFDGQWTGWDAYIRKFLQRPAYRKVWLEIRDEYDPGLVSYMDSLMQPRKESKP